MKAISQKSADKENRLIRQQCPVCGNSETTIFFEVDSIPVFCNILLDTRAKALAADHASISLGYCSHCGMIYNYQFDPSRVEYAARYENSLHCSPYFQSYAAQMAEHLVTTYQLEGKDAIEVGCGQGDFLDLLHKVGIRQAIGFDPSYVSNQSLLDNITIFPEAYSEKHHHYQADLVCCRHVLEHIATPLPFVQLLKNALNDQPDSVLFMEVPNAQHVFRDGGFWDILYEHCSYFTPQALEKLILQAGLKLIRIAERYEGQFLTIEANLSRKSISSSQDRSLIDNMVESIAGFSERFIRTVERWKEQLQGWQHYGKRVVLWGAGSKGVMFLNILGLSWEQIEYVVDINEKKHGRFVPRTGQQVIDAKVLKRFQPDIIILMNPIYHKEVETMIKEFRLKTELVNAVDTR